MRQFLFCLLLLVQTCLLRSQGYQALHGSPFAGSTAVFNNPAASVNSAYKWDLTLFSVQAKLSTNSVFIDKDGLRFHEGLSSHFIHANVDMSLFNFLYKIDNNRAFNFNIRARTYEHIKTLPINIVDTISSIHSLLITNRTTPFIQGFATSTGWIEGDLNYSQVLMENSGARLTAGATLQIMKGVSGAFIKLNKLSYLESKNATDTSYTFTAGGGSFAYSGNYDQQAGSGGGIKDFLSRTRLGLGLSLGIEYLLYNSFRNDEADNTTANYNWKFGVSIMDIGGNSFAPSANATEFANPITTIPDNTVDYKLSQPQSLQSLKDSLSTLFTSARNITENFSISNPTRLVINVDRNLGNNFYLNGEMSLNFYSSSSQRSLHSRELNLFTLVPRWETPALGAYLPVQFNTQGQLWVGMAVKLGPLTVGTHNLAILKKYPPVNGGAYLMLSVHPFGKGRVKLVDCYK